MQPDIFSHRRDAFYIVILYINPSTRLSAIRESEPLSPVNDFGRFSFESAESGRNKSPDDVISVYSTWASR